MRVLRFVALSLAAPAFAAGQAASPQNASGAAAYVVSYVEVMSSSIAEATTLFRQYREASRLDPGNLRIEVVQQTGRPDHFAVVELWRDESALDAHQRAVHTRQFRDGLERLRVSPYDERLHSGLTVARTSPAVAPGAIYVVTHADAIPTGKDEAVGLLTRWAEASRAESGNLRFEVLQQTSRQNHFTVVELWTDRRALESHAMSARARQFRDSFQVLSGALWDERLYRIVD
jgi:quinol monooxygenase YgiN